MVCPLKVLEKSKQKDTSQVIGGWRYDVKKIKPKIKEGVSTGGVSGGMVTIENKGRWGATGANGNELVTNPNLNIETVLHIIKNQGQILKYLLLALYFVDVVTCVDFSKCVLPPRLDNLYDHNLFDRTSLLPSSYIHAHMHISLL